jgi:hypothetical protein
VLRVDLARWLDGIDIAGGTPEEGVVRIGSDRNVELRDGLRAGLATEGVVTVEGSATGC